MTSSSRQRQWSSEASRLNHEASKALQPLHDDLQDVTPSFDGIVYFAVDQWHKNNANAVAEAQPKSDDTERFAFYKENISGRRIDLGATALGTALTLKEPTLLQSRTNPDRHVTWAQRMVIDNSIAGGLQAAFNKDFGPVPTDTQTIESVWKKHARTVRDVAGEFHLLSGKTDSIGDTLELLAPTTPNAFIVSWDLDKSTHAAQSHYGALRNYLIDVKELFTEQTQPLSTHVHDTGDGQDITIWLPREVDRSSAASLRDFGDSTILPLLDQLSLAHHSFVEDTSSEQPNYTDLNPQIHFAVGLGYVERDKRNEHTSQEYWPIATLHKESLTQETTFTANALKVLGPLLNKKYPR